MSHDTGTLTPEALRTKLDTLLALTDYRALLIVIVARPGLDDAINAARDEALREAGVAPEDVVTLDLAEDEATRRQLSELNLDRDLLLRACRMVWLRAHNAAEVRFLRAQAPDLTSALDLFTRVEPADTGADWPTCRDALRALMAERHRSLDFTGLLPNRPERSVMPLAELYMPLVPLPGEPSDSDPDGFIAAWMPPTPDGKPSRGHLVLGHPGSGKTTFLRHLAFCYATDDSDPLDIGGAVPILLSLSDYGRARETDRVQPLLDYLPEWLAAQGVPAATAVREHLDEIVLLLDGLDEMRSAAARRAVLDEVSRLAASDRVRAVVVTGRSFLVDELHPSHEPLQIRRTRPPSGAEIAQFVTRFSALRGLPNERADSIVDRIQHDSDLSALARTPLVLAFMVILDELEGRLPDRRIEIYYRLGEMLVERWTRTRSLGRAGREHDRPTRGAALRVLGPLAWWAIEQGGAVGEVELLAELTRIEIRRDPEEGEKQARALLDLLKLDTALLVTRPDGRWSFVHLSVAEYFAALHAERSPEIWHVILADPFAPGLREIVLFLAGQLGVMEGKVDRLDELGDAILERSKRPERYDAKVPTLIAALLAEWPGLSRRLGRALADRLLELTFTNTLHPESAFETQIVVVRALVSAHGSAWSVLRERLSSWLLDRPRSARWSLLLKAAFHDPLTETQAVPTRVLPLAARSLINDPFRDAYLLSTVSSDYCGPLLAALPGIIERYNIDAQRVAEPLLQSPDWRLRFIGHRLTLPLGTEPNLDALLTRVWPDLDPRPPIFGPPP